MGDRAAEGQSGGVNISGLVGTVDGSIVGRDMTVTTFGRASAAEIETALRPVAEAVRAAPETGRPEAEAKLAALKQETEKGKDADDGVVAKLVNGLVGMVPGAVSAVISAFATPVLGGIAGLVTKIVLGSLRDK